VATTAGPADRETSRTSLAELYERHVGQMVSLARLLTGDRDVAEDVAHDAFVRVAGRFGALRDPGAFEAYLRRTVVNLCRGRFRRLRVERAFLKGQRPPTEEVEPHGPEDRDALWSAIGALPYRQRAAVVLRFYEDLSEQQTGQVLRCSSRAVNALVSRAMATLRDGWNEEDR
jgi:RNA polymerase sigma-70 factor (sigma-E family)